MPDEFQSGANRRRHTAGIVAAYAGHHQLPSDQVGPLIVAVSAALARLGETAPEAPREPAVPVKRSVHRDYVICLECWFRAKLLRRHLGHVHGLTPDQYRARWKLAPGHSIVALGYSEMRSAAAKQFGLGRTGQRSAKAVTAKAAKPARRPRGRPRSAKKRA